jgi:hypothetical protein
MFLYYSVCSYGQLSWQPRAGSYSSKPISVFSFADNPAAVSEIKKLSIGIFGEKKFLMSELGDYSAAISLPAGPGSFGLLLNYSGSSFFHQTSAGLTYGRTIAEKIDLALQFNYDAMAFKGVYGKASAIYARAGFIARLTGKLRSGITVSNLFGGRFGREKEEKISSVYSVGLGYDASDKFYLGTRIIKEEGRDMAIVSDLQYRLVPQLVITAGFVSSTAAGWLGIGWIKGPIRIDISAGFQPQTGMSPGTLLQFTPELK